MTFYDVAEIFGIAYSKLANIEKRISQWFQNIRHTYFHLIWKNSARKTLLLYPCPLVAVSLHTKILTEDLHCRRRHSQKISQTRQPQISLSHPFQACLTRLRPVLTIATSCVEIPVYVIPLEVAERTKQASEHRNNEQSLTKQRSESFTLVRGQETVVIACKNGNMMAALSSSTNPSVGLQYVSVVNISLVPTVQSNLNTGSRKKTPESAKVLTSTPVQLELLELQQKLVKKMPKKN